MICPQYITNTGSKVVFRTNKNAPNYRLIVVDFNKPTEEHWTTLITVRLRKFIFSRPRELENDIPNSTINEPPCFPMPFISLNIVVLVRRVRVIRLHVVELGLYYLCQDT